MNSAFFVGNPEVIRLLLSQGAELEYKNARTWTSLSFLWDPERPPLDEINMAQILDICAREGFSAWNDADFLGWTLTHRAAAYGSGDDIRNLKYKRVNMHSYTRDLLWAPITVAVWSGNVSTFDELVKVLPKVEIITFCDTRGWNLLHFAPHNGSGHMMRVLLNLGIDRSILTARSDAWIKAELEWLELTAEDIARAYGHGDIWDIVIQELDSG